MTSSILYRLRLIFLILATIFLLFLFIALITEKYLLVIVPFAVLLFCYSSRDLKSLFFLLLLSLPWSVEYNFNISLGTDLPDEPLMILTTVLVLLHMVWNPGRIKKGIQHTLIIILFIQLLWITTTTIFSSDKLVSIKYLIAKSWYVAAFSFAPILLLNNKRIIKITAFVFLISEMILMSLVLIRHYEFNWKFENINDAVVPFFRNHVNYSAMLVCTIPVLLAAHTINRNSKTIRWLIKIALLITIIALFFSYARGAWLALLIGLTSYILIRKRLLLVSFIVMFLLIIGSVLWLKENNRYLEFAHEYKSTIFHKNFKEHLLATYKLKDVSTAERFNRWIAGMRMIKDNWLTGYGPNTFYDNYKAYTIPPFKTWISKNKDRSTIHNYYLLIMVEQGVPGFLFFLLLTGSMLYYSEHLYHKTKDFFYKTVTITLGSIITMILVVNFLSDLIETDKIGSLFFLSLGILVVTDMNIRSQAEEIT